MKKKEPSKEALAWKHSTSEEKRAVRQYRTLQDEAIRNGGFWGETDMLVASEVVSIIVARNERLKKAGIL